MPLPSPRYFDFGPFRLDWSKKILLREGVRVEEVEAKQLEILHYLIIHRDRTVTKTELLDAIWPETFVNESNVPTQINFLRGALGGTEEIYIKTIHRVGYTFSHDVTVSDERPDSFAHPVICVIPAAFLAAFSSFFFKLGPGFLGWSLVQASDSAGMGAFQGATAGLIWAGFIIWGVSAIDFLWEERPSRWRVIFVGGASGLVSGGLIVLIVASVFELDSLVRIGWIEPQITRYSAQFFEGLFVTTRLGWAYIISGMFLGIGMSLTRESLLASIQWSEFMQVQREVMSLRQALAIALGAARILARRCWPLFLFQMVAAVFVILVAEPANGASKFRSGRFGILTGLAGDCSAQVVGAYFGLIGMAFGLVTARWGMRLKPRRRVT